MKKVILLGSSIDLVKNPRGHLIDSFDIVWRTNHTGHPISIEKYPEILGSKHENWYCHDLSYSIFQAKKGTLISKTDTSIINKYNKIIHNLFDVEIKQLKKVGYIWDKEDNSKGIYNSIDPEGPIIAMQENNDINSNLLFKSPYKNLYFGYLNWVKDCYKMLNDNNLKLRLPPNQKPSSGMRMLVYLLKHYEHVHLIGFDGGATGHWYTDKKLNLNYHKDSDHITTKYNRFGKMDHVNKNGNKIAKHYLDLEYQFMKLMQDKGKVTIYE